MPVQYVTFSVEVTARLDCEMENWDYGVPGSPTYVSVNPDTIEVSGFEFEGISVDNMPKELQDILEDMAVEASIEGDWK